MCLFFAIPQIERMFDEKKNKSTVDFDALVDKYSKIKPGLA